MPFICPECNNTLDSIPLRCSKCDTVVVSCPKCRGTGHEVMTNFFTYDLTQDLSVRCRKCRGKGVLGEYKLSRRQRSAPARSIAC